MNKITTRVRVDGIGSAMTSATCPIEHTCVFIMQNGINYKWFPTGKRLEYRDFFNGVQYKQYAWYDLEAVFTEKHTIQRPTFKSGPHAEADL
jgi:hypothetical protein